MIESYQNELKNCTIYKILNEKCKDESDYVNASVIKLVNEVIEYACDKSKTIIKYLPEYTLHDQTHLFRVYQLMDRIIPKDTLNLLSIPELMMLSLVAFLHDIGMAPKEEHLRAWKKDWKESTPNEEEWDEYNKFARFRQTFPNRISEIKLLRETEQHGKADLIEGYLISEYIRETHEQRARDYIESDWICKIKFKDVDLTNEVAQVCFSHGNDALHLLKLEMNILCDETTYICLPFIGVILRLADLLDFDAKRTPSILFSHLSVRNPVSLVEWQKHRSIQSWKIGKNAIIFHAKCNHPVIEKSIHDFCNYIDKELIDCSNVLARLDDNDRQNEMERYKILLPVRVDRQKIVTSKNVRGEPLYTYRDTCFELSKNQVIDLLMGTKLYNDTKAALRELVQNSIDACLVAEALYESTGDFYVPEISIRYYTEKKQSYLEVEDNGVGMNQRIIDNYYSKVGSSYYKSKDFYELRARVNLKHEPISRFGIGILSCFMVSDTIEVETRKLLDDGEKDKPIQITIDGYDSIFTIKKGIRKTHGTKTKLILRKENPWGKMNKKQFLDDVKGSIPNPPFKINIATDKNNESEDFIIIDKNTFSSFSADGLRSYYWKKSEHIKEIKISLNSDKFGLKGEAIVAILENDDLPVSKIDGKNRNLAIEGEDYELENKIELNNNCIEKTGSVIEVDIDSGIKMKSSIFDIVHSKSMLSIHGISFPAEIFPHFEHRKEVAIDWPLPMLLVLDITGKNDLDLNTARTEIVYNNKWNEFEEDLATLIFKRLKESLSDDKYWKELLGVVLKKSSSKNLNIAIKKLI